MVQINSLIMLLRYYNTVTILKSLERHFSANSADPGQTAKEEQSDQSSLLVPFFQRPFSVEVLCLKIKVFQLSKISGITLIVHILANLILKFNIAS